MGPQQPGPRGPSLRDPRGILILFFESDQRATSWPGSRWHTRFWGLCARRPLDVSPADRGDGGTGAPIAQRMLHPLGDWGALAQAFAPQKKGPKACPRPPKRLWGRPPPENVARKQNAVAQDETGLSPLGSSKLWGALAHERPPTFFNKCQPILTSLSSTNSLCFNSSIMKY